MQSSTLLPLCATWDFCSHGACLRTPALKFNRYAAPAKLPIWPMSRNHGSQGEIPLLTSQNGSLNQPRQPCKHNWTRTV